MGESFADLKKQSRTANLEKANRRFATGGAVPDRAKSKTVETTGRTADRQMQAMERQVATAQPQRKAAGGPAQTPVQMATRMPIPGKPMAPMKPLAPMPAGMPLASIRQSALPLMNLSGTPTGAKRGGRQRKEDRTVRIDS